MKKFISVMAAAVFLFGSGYEASAQNNSIGVSMQEETRTSVYWQVLKYDITATLPTVASDRNLRVRATVSAKNVGNANGSTITLRLNSKAEILSAKVGANTATFRKSEEKAGNLQRISISIGGVQPNGIADVTLEYNLPVTENSGLNLISSLEAQFLPLSAWFPTPNSPFSPRGADFAPYNLTVTNPLGEVISAGKSNANSSVNNLYGQPFFVTGSFEKVSASGIDVFLPNGSSAADKSRAQELAVIYSEALDFAKQSLGVAEIRQNTKIVAVRRGAGFSDSGVVFVDSAVLRRPKIDSQTVTNLSEAAMKTVFGNLVAVSGNGYGAIREGLARFYANSFIEKKFGREAADSERLRQRIAYAAVVKRDIPISQATPLDDIYYVVSGSKGAMIWRLVAEKIGQAQFNKAIAEILSQRKTLNTNDVKNILTTQNTSVSEILQKGFDEVTDTDLMVGLPRLQSGASVVALRNLGSFEVNVPVIATLENGQTLNTTAIIPPKSFSESTFKTSSKIIRVEIDPLKTYPQTDYANDFAPREFSESDVVLEIKRSFDRQDFAATEKSAKKALAVYPYLEDAKILLGRSLIAQNRLDEAEKQFQSVIESTFGGARSQARANFGLGEIAEKRNRSADAVKFYETAIRIDGDYGVTLQSRKLRRKNRPSETVDESVKNFFLQFDKAVLSGRKQAVEEFVLAGELSKFASGLVGNQPEKWTTIVFKSEQSSPNLVSVETEINLKRLSTEPETVSAVFTLTRSTNGWKIAAIESFETQTTP